MFKEVEHRSTGLRGLDGILGGGLELDAITLAYGPSASGKTNFCMHMVRRVLKEGLRVVLIDSEGVSGARFKQVLHDIGEAELERLLVYHPFDLDEQERMIKGALRIQDAGLIVVDSVNVHYRAQVDLAGEKGAGQSLFRQVHMLAQHARAKRIPVLLTGQVYGHEEGTQPFARRTLDHTVKTMLRFQRADGSGRRCVHLIKHRSEPEGGMAWFRIVDTGLEETSAPGAYTALSGPAPDPISLGFRTADDLEDDL